MLLPLWLAVNCGQQATPLSFPDFIAKDSLQYVFKTDSFCVFSGLTNAPQSFVNAGVTKMALSRDSSAFFMIKMPSLQGTVVAFQEWISYSESHGQSRNFPEGIGKKAVAFLSVTERPWVIFYHDDLIFGVSSTDKDSTEKIAAMWAREIR